MRSSWKLPYINRSLVRKLKSNKKLEKLIFYCRRSVIPRSLIDKKIQIYNGIWELSFFVEPQHVGMKFGEFSRTKRLGETIHTIKVRKK